MNEQMTLVKPVVDARRPPESSVTSLQKALTRVRRSQQPPYVRAALLRDILDHALVQTGVRDSQSAQQRAATEFGIPLPPIDSSKIIRNMSTLRERQQT